MYHLAAFWTFNFPFRFARGRKRRVYYALIVYGLKNKMAPWAMDFSIQHLKPPHIVVHGPPPLPCVASGVAGLVVMS